MKSLLLAKVYTNPPLLWSNSWDSPAKIGTIGKYAFGLGLKCEEVLQYLVLGYIFGIEKKRESPRSPIFWAEFT